MASWLLLLLLLAACGSDEETAAEGTATLLPAPATATALSTATPRPTSTTTAPLAPLSPLTTPTLSPAPTSPVATPLPTATVNAAPAQQYRYQVINSYPHDPGAFTQGLIYHAGFLYEGTGQYGASSIRQVELETGEVLQQVDLPSEFFGEGITLFNDQFYQLTWQNRTGFLRAPDNFAVVRQFAYPTEGWGITHDGQKLIMSDGSATLFFWDAEPTEIGQITVRLGDRLVDRLNELEYINGEVFANVWQTDYIVRIDPSSGHVTGVIDLTDLLTPAERAGADVLNGIAYDSVTDRLFVTGKYWPKLFEIKLVESK